MCGRKTILAVVCAIILNLGVISCAKLPETDGDVFAPVLYLPTTTSKKGSTASPSTILTTQVPNKLATLTFATDTITPTPQAPTLPPFLPQTDEIVFTIENTLPWSGKSGDKRPDWLAWGAGNFTVAPDGSFWIIDSAPNVPRLLQYSREGELLQIIPRDVFVVWPYDLVVLEESIWLLGSYSVQPMVVQIDMNGNLLSSVDIPENITGDYVSNIFNLWIGEDNQVILSGYEGYFILIDSSGEVVSRPIDAFSYQGHTIKHDRRFRIDGKLLALEPSYKLLHDPFLGANPDGSFAIGAYLEGSDEKLEYIVIYYTADGEMMAIARQHKETLSRAFQSSNNHNLAFGPDGQVYQIISHSDRSIQIVRLGFSRSLPPLPATKTPKPSATYLPLTALPLPSNLETQEAQARYALISFFLYASQGHYPEAVEFFDGDLSNFIHEPKPEESLEEYWQVVCTIFTCLPVAEITEVEQVSEVEFIYYVVFVNEDGSRFQIGPCCGADEASHPFSWQFRFQVKQIGGRWKVISKPVFRP